MDCYLHFLELCILGFIGQSGAGAKTRMQLVCVDLGPDSSQL